MKMPPIVIGATLIAVLLAFYAMHMEIIPALAVGMIAGGAIGFVLDGGKGRLPIMLAVVGVAMFLTAPAIAGFLSVAPSGGTGAVTAATFAVTCTNGTGTMTQSGNTWTVPVTYNSTANTLSVSAAVLTCTATRSDTGTADAGLEVSVTPAGKSTDTATGLQYETVEKDSLGKFKVYVGTGTEYQQLSRVYPFMYGTSQASFNVTIDANPKGYDYLNSYEGATTSVVVGGTTYQINIQKIAEVA